MHTQETVDKVAKEFLSELTSWFKADGVNPTPDMIENGNDYFDANMAMDAAFKKCGINWLALPDEEKQTENDNLFNDAWSRAVELAKAA